MGPNSLLRRLLLQTHGTILPGHITVRGLRIISLLTLGHLFLTLMLLIAQRLGLWLWEAILREAAAPQKVGVGRWMKFVLPTLSSLLVGFRRNITMSPPPQPLKAFSILPLSTYFKE